MMMPLEESIAKLCFLFVRKLGAIASGVALWWAMTFLDVRLELPISAIIVGGVAFWIADLQLERLGRRMFDGEDRSC